MDKIVHGLPRFRKKLTETEAKSRSSGNWITVILMLPGDFIHAHASRLAARFREGIPFTLLAELERSNTIRRALRESVIAQAEHDAAFRQIQADLTDGILARRETPQAEVYRIARELSERHTPSIPARSLDILQTAAALLIGTNSIHTFDLRQRQLATACGLKVHPATMPKPLPQ